MAFGILNSKYAKQFIKLLLINNEIIWKYSIINGLFCLNVSDNVFKLVQKIFVAHKAYAISY